MIATLIASGMEFPKRAIIAPDTFAFSIAPRYPRKYLQAARTIVDWPD
jgi:hypothetical protein